MEDIHIQKLIDAARKDEFKTAYEHIFALKAPELEKNKPLILAFFGPSTVGKDTLIEPLRDLAHVSFVTTATSRSRRPEEPENGYIWLPARKDKETVEQYNQRMIKEFKLIEFDSHFGDLYGLPLESVQTSAKKGVAVIRTNYAAIETLKEVLGKDYNVLAISVHPEYWAELKARITKLRNTPGWRISEAIRSIDAALKVADYVIFNPHSHGQLRDTQYTLVNFVKALYKKIS